MLLKNFFLVFFSTVLFITVVSGKNISTTPSTEYTKAENLAIEANKLLKAGEVIKADQAIRESIKLYPTKAIFDYTKTLCGLSDIKTANNLMDLAYQQLSQVNSKTILLLESFPSKYENGIMVAVVKEYTLPRAQFNFGYETYLVSKEFGDQSSMIKIIETLLALDIQKSKNKAGFDFEYFQQESFKWELPLLKRDFSKSIKALNERSINQYFTEERTNGDLAYIYIEAEEYENALKYSNKLSGVNKRLKYKLNFMIYAKLGNNDASLKNYNLMHEENKNLYSKMDLVGNDEFYYLAVIDLNNKDYNKALVNLDSTLKHRINSLGGFSTALLIDRWKVYKSMGDAYTGLQQFEKARDCYNISLLSNPDFEPSVTALVQLETKIANASAVDKIAPVINLLDPSPKRGLKVSTSSANVLIKGFAQDASGIKEVSINNKIVYSQNGGDFWGDVPLNEGLNKVTISATDLMGNKALQVFEIERSITKTVVAINNELIVPIEIKTGKNVCLLIGAQNYTDANIPSLANPVADAVRLKLILKNNYNFAEESIITLFNPSVNDVKRQLLELTTQLQPEDNLLIFYAGHGIWVEKEKKGYWLMTDAKRNDPNTWLPNKTVLDLIAKIPSRHTLLITDACFSGSVFKTRGLTDGAPKAIQEMEAKISRIAITSGNDTEVPDESVFMKYLIKALSENKEKYLTAQKMFITQIIEAVMTESKTEPRYGTLELAGHVGGDFIFIKK
jgi:tetratricopeptide (TPR) repeat protein